MDDHLAAALLPLLAMAALVDLRRRRIPNWIAGAVAGLGLAALAMNHAGMLWQHVLVALLTLVAGIAIWSRGLLGGGDVKLLAALSLWAGPAHVGSLLLATGLAGGLLALGLMLVGPAGRLPATAMLPWRLARLLPGTSREDSLQAAAAPVGTLPYGLAIACGGGWLVHLLLA